MPAIKVADVEEIPCGPMTGNSLNAALEQPSCPNILAVNVLPVGTAIQEPEGQSPSIEGLIILKLFFLKLFQFF